MITDWMLVRRMAHEIESRLRGGKVRDAGLLPDGRPALAIWSRGETHLLCLDLFGTPPLVTIEDGELPIHAEPGFIRSLATTLRTTTLLAAKSRRDDRLLRLTFGTRSRFGVGDEIELFVELVPRFGNAILVKGGVVVSAMKEFTLAENPARSILAGQPYELPPLLRRNHAAAGEPVTDDDVLRAPVYVTRNDGGIASIALLPQPDAEPHDSLLDALAEFRLQRRASGAHASAERKRAALLRRLNDREKKLRRELGSISDKRAAADGREALQREGEDIFATLHELDEAQRESEIERAQQLFARYKKLGASIPHLEERRAHVELALRALEELRWESERASDGDLPDVELAVDQLERPRAQAARTARRKRRPMEVLTDSGARILIGRNPIENADLTFRVARPDDLWLHAQNVPGAHVILQRDDRAAFADDDIALAAEYAAGYSKARASSSVAVDYTRRKYVRKQKDAAPGLVWYTNFKTLVTVPRTLEP